MRDPFEEFSDKDLREYIASIHTGRILKAEDGLTKLLMYGMTPLVKLGREHLTAQVGVLGDTVEDAVEKVRVWKGEEVGELPEGTLDTVQGSLELLGGSEDERKTALAEVAAILIVSVDDAEIARYLSGCCEYTVKVLTKARELEGIVTSKAP